MRIWVMLVLVAVFFAVIATAIEQLRYLFVLAVALLAAGIAAGAVRGFKGTAAQHRPPFSGR